MIESKEKLSEKNSQKVELNFYSWETTGIL